MTEHWDNETWKKSYKSCFFISTLFSIQVSFVSKRKLSYPCLVVKSTNKLNFIKSLTHSNIILEVPVYFILIFIFGAILLFIIKYEKILLNKKYREEKGGAVSRKSNYHLRVGKWWNTSVTWVRVSVNNTWKNISSKKNKWDKERKSCFKIWHKSFVLFLIKYKNVFAILCKSWDLEMTDRKQKWETKEREIEICEECWDYNTQQHRKLGAIQMAAQETIDITISIVFKTSIFFAQPSIFTTCLFFT